MRNKLSKLTNFLVWSSKTAGKPHTFVIALAIIFLWIIVGFIWGFSTRWILILDTIATINAALMVFIIQNTQIRETKAMHIKLDGLIDAIKDAENGLIAIEEEEVEELEKLRAQLIKKKMKK